MNSNIRTSYVYDCSQRTISSIREQCRIETSYLRSYGDLSLLLLAKGLRSRMALTELI